MLLQMTKVHSFSRLSSIPVCVCVCVRARTCTTSSLSIIWFWTLGCFRILALVNNGSVNTRAPVSFHVSASAACVSALGRSAGSPGGSVLGVEKLPLFPAWLCQLMFPPKVHQWVSFSLSLIFCNLKMICCEVVFLFVCLGIYLALCSLNFLDL